jgi:MraZ protein
MFKVRCQAKATLDDKGRLALPAPLRRALKERHVTSLVLTYHKGFVWCYTQEDFASLEDEIASHNEFDDDVLLFVHGVIASAHDVDIDRQGRIRVPPILRESAGLDKDVVVNSVLRRIEVWDVDAWEDRFKDAMVRASGAFARSTR